MAKSEFRNTKYETIPKPKSQMIKTSRHAPLFELAVSVIPSFEFVSDFDIRNSDFRFWISICEALYRVECRDLSETCGTALPLTLVLSSQDHEPRLPGRSRSTTAGRGPRAQIAAATRESHCGWSPTESSVPLRPFAHPAPFEIGTPLGIFPAIFPPCRTCGNT